MDDEEDYQRTLSSDEFFRLPCLSSKQHQRKNKSRTKCDGLEKSTSNWHHFPSKIRNPRITRLAHDTSVLRAWKYWNHSSHMSSINSNSISNDSDKSRRSNSQKHSKSHLHQSLEALEGFFQNLCVSSSNMQLLVNNSSVKKSLLQSSSTDNEHENSDTSIDDPESSLTSCKPTKKSLRRKHRRAHQKNHVKHHAFFRHNSCSLPDSLLDFSVLRYVHAADSLGNSTSKTEYSVRIEACSSPPAPMTQGQYSRLNPTLSHNVVVVKRKIQTHNTHLSGCNSSLSSLSSFPSSSNSSAGQPSGDNETWFKVSMPVSFFRDRMVRNTKPASPVPWPDISERTDAADTQSHFSLVTEHDHAILDPAHSNDLTNAFSTTELASFEDDVTFLVKLCYISSDKEQQKGFLPYIL